MSYIKVEFPGGIETAFKPAFEDSIAFWNAVIKSGAPDYTFTRDVDLSSGSCGADRQFSKGDTISGLTIFASTPPIDGVGQILGQAGPCMFNGNFPLFGIMQFDSADSQSLLDDGQFYGVVVHEMGHVIGIGTLWGFMGLLEGKCVGSKECDPVYIGVNGNEGYKQLNPDTATLGEYAPVANTGGSGTRNGHWREATFENELMTGYLNQGVENPLSIMTIKSLKDLGYSVDESVAEDYTMPDGVVRGSGLRAELKNDMLDFGHVDVREFEALQEIESGSEENIDAEFAGVFVLLIAGFLFLAGLMGYLHRSQRRMLEKMSFGQTVATKSPMHLHELA